MSQVRGEHSTVEPPKRKSVGKKLVAGMCCTQDEISWLKSVAKSRGQSLSGLMRDIFWPAADAAAMAGRLKPLVREDGQDP